jgi:hypothetical protein
MNLIGELLRFADRDFYKDWWNSPGSQIINQLIEIKCPSTRLKSLYYLRHRHVLEKMELSRPPLGSSSPLHSHYKGDELEADGDGSHILHLRFLPRVPRLHPTKDLQGKKGKVRCCSPPNLSS